LTSWFKIFLLIFLLPQFIFAQSNIRFEHLTVKDGLSQNHVTRILKDSKGFMWFCTQNGLNRYDGKSFKVYKHSPDNLNSLSNNHIEAIHEDKNGNLWIGTYGGGVNKFELTTEKFTHYRHDPDNSNSLSSDLVLSIYEDNSGHLWFGTSGSGINKFNKNKGTFVRYSNNPDDLNSLSHNVVRAFFEDEFGILWIGTDGGGLNKFDERTGKFTGYKNDPENPKTLSHDFIFSIIEDEDGTLWLATGRGLNKFDRDTETFSHYRHDPNDPYSGLQTLFKSITEPGVIWISTHGIYKFNIKKEKFTHYKHEPYDPTSLSSNTTVTIYEDDSGLLWVGTADKGLNKYNKAQENILHYKNDPTNVNSLSANFISSIHEDKSRILWVGTDGGGLHKFDRKKGEFKHYVHQMDNSNSLSSNKVYSIVEEKPGILWIGTFDGLNRLDVKNNKFDVYKHDPKNLTSLSHNTIYTLHIDRASNLWIGTIQGPNKLILSENEKIPPVFFHYKHNPNAPPGINGNWVLAFYEDDDGFLWVGTDGLDKFDKRKEKFYCYQHDPHNPNSLSNNLVSTIYRDKNGVLWIGTFGGGLNRFNPDTENFIHYREKDGLANDNIYGILEDNHQNLWLSTKNGLSKFNPDAVDDQGVALPTAFKNYYVHDGFQDNEFTASYFKNSKGEMFFGGINGFNAFYPDSLKENLTIPDVVITDFKVFNENYKLDTSITEINQIVLSHDKNFFSFDFAVLDYTAPKKNNYAYKLDGLDEDWNYVGNRNFAHYTNLSPGEYVFRVKGSNNNGIWNEEGTSIRIFISPPWWKTGWAYGLYFLLVVLLIYGTWRFQMNGLKMKQQMEMEHFEAEKLREVDHLKSRFFANISHEFRTPLTLIQGPVKQMLSGEFKGNFREQYRIILRYSNRLLNLINQILDLSKLEAGRMTLKVTCTDVVQFLKGIVQSFASLAERKKIALKLNADDESLMGYIDRDKLEKIVNNLLSNAFKFTPEGGEVVVDLSLRGDSSSEAMETTKQSPFSKRDGIATSRQVGTRKDSGSPGFIQISIFNSGIGISPDQLERIFDRFYQADDSYTKDSKGTGIGLALTKELAEANHGEIRVESESNKGTTFTVWLPIEKEHFKPEEIVEVKPPDGYKDPEVSDSEIIEVTEDGRKDSLISKPSGGSKSSPLLLIVEDNPDVTSYISSFLEKDFRIIIAENGEAGFKKALERFPDLIISDVMMPVMDGFELCKQLKSNEHTSHIPVILLTAKADMDSKIEGLEFGADDYVTKPFDDRELHVRAKNLIEQRRKLHEKFSRMVEVKPGEIAASSMDEQFLKRLLDVFENHIAESDYSTKDFAREVGMSRSNLHRKLQALTSQPTHEFLRTLRLKRAAQLLKQSAGTVTEIAYAVGFTNPSHFSKIFRQQFGQTPSEFASKNQDIGER
jgi:signal transduction histidine kinase/ligand-binding sensor domain-containing protein/DNA-binding response OmpR family regulator